MSLCAIALIAPPWLPVPPPSYGGVEAVVDRLARGFDAAGVATSAGARLRMVEDGLTGFVRDRPEDLVEAVHRIPEIARDACRKAVEADFSTARMVRDHLNFFEDLGGRTPSPTP